MNHAHMKSGGDYNTQGKYHETLFKAECLRRSIIVLQPEQTHLPFDVGVLNRGKFITVQIKGTTTLHAGRNNKHYRIQSHAKIRGGVLYRDLGVDYMAVYGEPTKTWYIIPTVLATGKTLEIRLSDEAWAHEWRERWDLFGGIMVVD